MHGVFTSVLLKQWSQTVRYDSGETIGIYMFASHLFMIDVSLFHRHIMSS